MFSNMKWKGKLTLFLASPLCLLGVLILMDIIAAVAKRQALGFVLLFTAAYGLLIVFLFIKGMPFLADEIERRAAQFDTAQKQLMEKSELPYALLDQNGRILWSNPAFSAKMGIARDYDKSITTLFPSVTRELLKKEDQPGDLYGSRGGRNYRISISRLQLNGDTSEVLPSGAGGEMVHAVYLFDETELLSCREQVESRRMVSALIYIDNYEEAFSSIEDVKKSLLAALIDRKVSQYFARMGGLVFKLEKDKYVAVFQKRFMAKMVEDKFRLLEDVRGVKVGNEIAVTLSMGIGVTGENYNDGYETARAAIDLALGRGGAQVVVKEGENITYYGGKTKQVASRNRVKARVKAQALQEIMESCENVLTMGHSLTDVDSLGAAVGVFCAARSVGKKCQIVINNPTTSVRPLIETFSKDKGYPEDMFINSEQALEMVSSGTLVMVVDTNRPSYTECPPLLKQTKRIVAFDHHRQGAEVIENPILSYIEPYASSACEMVAEVLQYFGGGIRLNATESDCIYAGILIDTNNFMTKTGVRTFEAAAYLKRSGADVTRVRKMLRNDMDCYKARAEAVRNAEVYHGAFAISICPAGNVESPTIVGAQAADELLNIIGIKASFVLTEYNNKIFVSARSIDEINVQVIMERMGGGGHMNTAGAQLRDCTPEQAKRIIQATLDEMLEKGDISK